MRVFYRKRSSSRSKIMQKILDGGKIHQQKSDSNATKTHKQKLLETYKRIASTMKTTLTRQRKWILWAE